MIKNQINGTIEHVGGDFHLGDINYNNYEWHKNKVLFEVVETNHYKEFPAPIFSLEINQRIKQNKLLIIGGNYNFNKSYYLKHLATNFSNPNVIIKECTQIANFYELSNFIREEQEHHVLLLNDLAPQDIAFRFNDLKNVVRTGKHLVLICTDVPYDSWHFSEDQKATYWFEIPEKNIYTKKTLEEYLLKKSEENDIRNANITKELVKYFETTEQIDAFVELIKRQTTDITKETIYQVIKKSTLYKLSNIDQWFNMLDEDQKLLVIGLSLLDGIHENQFFEIYDRIVEQVWTQRNKNIHPVDYKDLIPLYTFFELDGHIIKSKYRYQRRRIIEIAWKTHKRYLLSAIPILTDLILESLQGNYTNWNLFGTKAQRTNLRNVIGETFSDIGLYTFKEIEGELIRLASFPHIAAQVVVAKAIARWKVFGETDKIFSLLKNWQANAELRNLINAINNKRVDNSNQYTPVEFLQSTIVLILGYLSEITPKDNLTDYTINLLRNFLPKNKPLVVDRMRYTIERFTSFHFNQIEGVLKKEILKYRHFAEPVGYGIARSCNNGYSQEVRRIIEQWLNYCETENENRVDNEKFLHQDNIIIAIILALKYIDYQNVSNSITIEYAYKTLEELRQTNHQKKVRKHLLDAIVYLIELNFLSEEGLSIDFISNIDAKERELIVAEFRNKYLDQRSLFNGGEYTTTIDGYSFSTWVNNAERPVTNIEKLLKKWKNSPHAILSQIAFKCYADIDIIEEEEIRLIEKHREAERIRIEAQEKQAEIEKENPEYRGEIEANKETITFIKICNQFIQSGQEDILKNISPIILQENRRTEGAKKLILRLDDNPHDNDFTIVDNITYVYELFRTEDYDTINSPLKDNLQSIIFYLLTCFTVENKKLLKAFSPFLIKTKDLNYIDTSVIFEKIQAQNNWWLQIVFWLCKRPILVIVMIAMLVAWFIFN